jgi:rhodanese-related sulfurtransferase
MSGFARVPMRKFLAYDAVGSAIWAGSALLIGIMFNDALAGVLDMISRYGGYGLIVLGVVLALYLLYRVLRRKATIRRFSHVPRVSLDELDDWRARGCTPVLLDVRADPANPLPGAVATDPHGVLATDPLPWPLEAHIVVYCACPDEISAAILADKLRKAGYMNTWALLGGYNAWLAREGRQEDEPLPPPVASA